MRLLATAIAAALFACCTSSPRPMQDVDPNPGTNHGTSTPDVKEPPVPTASAPASASLTFKSRRRDHPPLSTLFVDASLRNPGPRARWFLVTASTGKGQNPMAQTAFGVGVWSFPGTGKVVVAEFGGASPFYAIELPPEAEVELRELKLRLTGEPETDSLPIEVIVADGFTLGGQPPIAWTQVPATSEARADATQKDATKLRAFTVPDLKDVPVEIQGAVRLDASITIPK